MRLLPAYTKSVDLYSAVLVRSAAVALLLAFLLGTGKPAYGQDGPSLETISKAWQDRQGQVQAIRMDWVERQTEPKGSLTRFLSRTAPQSLESMGIKPGAVIPPEDVTYEAPCSLALDGIKVRHTREDRQWSAKESAYVPQPYVTAFDGKLGKHFIVHGTSYTPWPVGIIRRRFPEATALYLVPIFMTFRACSPEYRLFDLQTMAPTGRRLVIQKRSCYEWERRSRSFTERFWVDPSRDCVIVSYQTMKSEQVITKIDIGYREDAVAHYVPEKWTIVNCFPDGKLHHSMQATVSSYVVSPELGANEFEIEFPAGTLVEDASNPGKSAGYIVKESGTKRMIMPDEVGATYEQLVHSDTGGALGGKQSALRFWTLIAACGIAILAGSFLLWRKWPLRKLRLRSRENR